MRPHGATDYVCHLHEVNAAGRGREVGSLLGVHISPLEGRNGGGEQGCRQVDLQSDINWSKG